MLGVKEYYIFNPKYPKTLPAFLAYKLKDGAFESVNIENGKVKSDVLGLDLVDTGENLRLYNPKTKEYLKTTEELSDENEKLKIEVEQLKKIIEGKN